MRRWMLALGFALVVPAPFASAQEQGADTEPSAAPAKSEPPAPEPAAAPSEPAVQPATADAPQKSADVQPASAKKKRKRSGQKAAESAEAVPAPVPNAPAGTTAASPTKGVIESGKDLPDQPAGAPMTDKQAVEADARAFFFSIMNGDARAITRHSVVPFVLEDRRIATQDELFQEWLKQLRSRRTDLLVLYGVQVLTPEEMEKAYGKPPARLANFPWKTGKSFIAVGNLSGHAAIAVFRETQPGDFAVAGYTD